jgi:hypothetical protein
MYEPMPPPQVMAFPPPPPPPEPVASPTLATVPEQIPIPPPPAEEERKSEDMEIEATEALEVPAVSEQPVVDEGTRMVYSAQPTFSQPASTFSQPAPTFSLPDPTFSQNAPAFSQTTPAFSQTTPAFSQMAPAFSQQSNDPPPPPTVVFPTHIYSAVPQIQKHEETKTAAQKAAEELMQMVNPVEQPLLQPVKEPEPVVVQEPYRGFVPVQSVEPEVVQEPVQKPEPVVEPESEPANVLEREITAEKQPSGDPIKTTAQQLLERIKQKQLKAQASSQAGGSNPLIKSARRFFNPVAMVAGSTIQFAMASAKKNVTWFYNLFILSGRYLNFGWSTINRCSIHLHFYHFTFTVFTGFQVFNEFLMLLIFLHNTGQSFLAIQTRPEHFLFPFLLLFLVSIFLLGF